VIGFGSPRPESVEDFTPQLSTLDGYPQPQSKIFKIVFIQGNDIFRSTMVLMMLEVSKNSSMPTLMAKIHPVGSGPNASDEFQALNGFFPLKKRSETSHMA